MYLEYVLLLIFSSILFSIFTGGKPKEIPSICFWVGGFILLPSQIKRLHDIGLSGWFILLSFLPIFNILFALGLFLVSGTTGPNKYGSDPRATQYSNGARNERTREIALDPLDNRGASLGVKLGNFIINQTEEVEWLKTLQEKLEMRYFLMLETDRLLFVHLHNYREQVVKGMLAHVLDNATCSQKCLDEYNERIPFYMSANELFSKIGAIPGTRAFVLSYFLQRVRGQTTGKNVTDVLLNKREFKLDDMSEFLNVIESMMVIAFLSDQLIAIKEIIDQFKEMEKENIYYDEAK